MSDILLHRRRCMGGVKRDYLCFSLVPGQSGTNRIHLVKSGSPSTPELYYSTDKKTWTLWSDVTQYISLDEPIYLKGNNTISRFKILMGWFCGYNGSSNFSVNNYWRFLAENNTTKLKVSGDITSIIGWCSYLNEVCFSNLFQNNKAIEDASELDFSNCQTGYRRRQFTYMFQECSSLRFPPAKLAFEPMTASVYANMFYNCSALEYAPEILSRTLGGEKGSSLRQMFYGCRNINRIVCLKEEKVSDSADAYQWLRNVSATGVFVRSKNVSDDFWPIGENGIPTNWTVEVEP